MLELATAPGAPFEATLARLGRRGEADLDAVEPAVREILAAVRAEGDAAVLRFVERFEQRKPSAVLVRDYGGREALESLSTTMRDSLELAANRIREYHQRQLETLPSFEYQSEGISLGSRQTPLRRVGVYVPGGKAFYPSSVLMCAVVAQVAGVEDIVVATPSAEPAVRAACHLAGVSAMLDAGGAQAIAALAYGTESVPRVDKIVGPGNLYVAAAKRLVFGTVDIDSIAGPSEILVVADDSAEPAIVAADLLSQAEHDEAAYSLLLSTSPALVETVQAELEGQLQRLSRREIASASLARNGVALLVPDTDALVRVANELAVEHVAVQTRDPRQLAARIVRAGAVFVGHNTPEAAGDYVAGPSHVLPTGGAARFASPLGVYDFVSRSSMIEYGPEALVAHQEAIVALAQAEGLDAHARAVTLRTRRD